MNAAVASVDSDIPPLSVSRRNRRPHRLDGLLKTTDGQSRHASNSCCYVSTEIHFRPPDGTNCSAKDGECPTGLVEVEDRFDDE